MLSDQVSATRMGRRLRPADHCYLVLLRALLAQHDLQLARRLSLLQHAMPTRCQWSRACADGGRCAKAKAARVLGMRMGRFESEKARSPTVPPTSLSRARHARASPRPPESFRAAASKRPRVGDRKAGEPGERGRRVVWGDGTTYIEYGTTCTCTCTCTCACTCA